MIAYEHFTLDIETANAEPTEAERWMRLHWSPAPSWKPETIGNRYLEMLEKKKERLALIDASPIICVSVKTDRDLRCLHAMRTQEPRMVAGGMVEGFDSERSMLIALRNLLEAGADESTAIIGHNIRHFDLPKLRKAFIRNGLKIPVALVSREQPIFDTMKEYGFGFSLIDNPFLAVSDVAEALGIPHHKATLDGCEIPELHAAGQVDAIVSYALLDVCLEYAIFLRMTGQVHDEELCNQVIPQPVPA